MTTKLLTKAQKLSKIAQLKQIPEQLLPQTLKYNIKLPNVRKIQVDYHTQCKDIGVTFQFLRKYIADIRYHNPDIQIVRNRSAQAPIKLNFAVHFKERKAEQSVEVIDPTKFGSPEMLRERLEQIGGSGSSGQKGQNIAVTEL